jgi:hypothetical protein
MIDTLFWISIGVLIGWNLPQPVWAVFAQAKLTDFFKNLFNNTNK